MKCCFENKKHKKCISKKIKGFSMTASCAPYKYCKRMTKKRKSVHKR